MIKGNYNLLHNTAYIDYCGDESVEVGKIVDITSGEDVMYIYYEKNLFRTHGYHTCIDVYEDENGEYPVAKIDDLHRDCLFTSPDVFLTLMLHELGHYKNGDLTQENLTNKEIADERMNCVLSGKIQEIERKADAFAISHVGKSTFMRTMDYLIRMRQKRKDDGMMLAIKEFELRKKAARNIR